MVNITQWNIYMANITPWSRDMDVKYGSCAKLKFKTEAAILNLIRLHIHQLKALDC